MKFSLLRRLYSNILVSTCIVLFSVVVFGVNAESITLEVCVTECSSLLPPSPPSPGGGGGGGGGGGSSESDFPVSEVRVSGRAYPGSKVTLLKDAQLVGSTVAGPDAIFSITLKKVSTGSYIFSIYGEDGAGRKSSPFTFPANITEGVIINITGIFIAPTIDTDKQEVKKGDTITILGRGSPVSDVTISVNSSNEFFGKVKTDIAGAYLYNFDTSVLEYGNHDTKAKISFSNEISPYSKSIGFVVGDKNVLKTSSNVVLKGELNGDGKVNIVDFSIAAYWYKRANPPLKIDINVDGMVDIRDFSIMAFYWTG